MSAVIEAIENLRSRPSGFVPSPEEYRLLLERIELEADMAEESRRNAHERAWKLAARQGVKPIHNMSELKADFWPEEESIDDFLSWVRDIHRNDNLRSISE